MVAVDPPRVLIVDDRHENRVALRAVLEPLPVIAVEADSGEAALREVLTHDFAVILLDVKMPGIDGLETAELIKARGRSRDIPIIFLTAADADVAQIFAGYAAGAVDYLLKPFGPLVLRSKVQVFADLDRQRRELVRSTELVRNAFDAAPSGMALCDRDGLVLEVNPALERLAGRPVGREPVAGLLHERDRPALTERLRAIDGDGDADGPWTAHLLGGRGLPVPVTVGLAAVCDLHREVQQVLVQLTDDRDRRIAATLQRALLPERLPTVAGVTLAAHIAPGRGGTRVGGDWYDAIPLPGGRLGIVVGDVAGHGIDAAARMGELRSVARAYALEGHGPAALVERMNGYHAALGADLMTTMMFAIVEIDSNIMRFVTAGHPPPVIVGADGTTAVVRGAGPPLGVLDTWRYEERTAELGPGVSALLYTDGLVERRGEQLDACIARLREAAVRPGTPEELCAHILRAVDAEGADDDVTLVVVRAEALMGPSARLKLSPDPAALTSLRRVLARWLAEAGAQRDEVGELVMAANEAWQNALEHGTGFARTTVDIELEARDGQVLIAIRDPGLPSGAGRRVAADPDRGRGIDLMRGLADEVSLELAPHGSVVRLRRALRAPAPLAAPAATEARAPAGARPGGAR
ncbi:SpoIIE family protein phosphatase [Baekduia soli]|nr:SpoIIE family protein phosphatase [Baekduia soli]